MFRRFFAWMSKYERHLSALAMIAGFVADNIAFKRIDLIQTQLLFLVYTVTCLVAIPWLHYIESRAEVGYPRPRWRSVLPIATQFALGGFWSAFLIFYSRTAVLGASWPFLLLLFAIFILNEALHKYHDRLVFTSILFFFALYSCAIFELPIYTHTVGTQTFLESGAITVAVFAAFLTQLRVSGRQRFLKDAWRIRAGALLVLTVLNVFYFANILPPLPISLVAGGIYHGVARQGNVYVAEAEEQDWKVDFGAPAVLHVVPDESLYAYSAVFAPTALSTTIVHVWQWYDPVAKTWVTKSSLAFPINGGRDGGYRGYSAKTNPDAGMWRVDVETGDGHLIGRLRFTVVPVSLPPAETTETLN